MAINLSEQMNLPIPGVGTEDGPQYAEDINSSLTIIDQHDHSPGLGVPVTPSGLNISSDLTFNNNNLTNARSLRLYPQVTPLALPSDLGCLYEAGTDLYYNDGLGNQIRITQSGGIAGTPGSISNLTPPASVTYVSANKTYVFQSAANTPGNLDGASVNLRNLSANSKALTLAPPNSMGADYTLVLPSLPGSTKIMTLDASGNIAAAYSVDGTTIAVAANVIGVPTSGINTTQLAANAVTQAKLALRPTNNPAAAGEIAVSASSGTYSSGSLTFANATNLTVDITTLGRPVMVMLQDDGTGTANTYGEHLVAATTVEVWAGIARDGVLIAQSHLTIGISADAQILGFPTNCVQILDPVAAGTYNYTIQVKVGDSNDRIHLINTKLVAYEI